MATMRVHIFRVAGDIDKGMRINCTAFSSSQIAQFRSAISHINHRYALTQSRPTYKNQAERTIPAEYYQEYRQRHTRSKSTRSDKDITLSGLLTVEHTGRSAVIGDLKSTMSETLDRGWYFSI